MVVFFHPWIVSEIGIGPKFPFPTFNPAEPQAKGVKGCVEDFGDVVVMGAALLRCGRGPKALKVSER